MNYLSLQFTDLHSWSILSLVKEKSPTALMQSVADKAIMHLWCFERKEVDFKKNQLIGSSFRARLAAESKLCKALKMFSLPRQPSKF